MKTGPEIEIHLKFNPKELQWTASIDGKPYGAHRWEGRAFKIAQEAFSREKPALASRASFLMKLEWPPHMKKAVNALRKSHEKLLEAERAAEEARREHDLLTGQYIAGWKDSGLSNSMACQLGGINLQFYQRYFDLNGGEEAAAETLWKTLGTRPPHGVLGKKSWRTQPTGRKNIRLSDDSPSER